MFLHVSEIWVASDLGLAVNFTVQLGDVWCSVGIFKTRVIGHHIARAHLRLQFRPHSHFPEVSCGGQWECLELNSHLFH